MCLKKSVNIPVQAYLKWKKVSFTGLFVHSPVFFLFINHAEMKNELDETDIGILRLLQKNAQLTNKEIAAQLHKSIAAVHERVRQLTEEGYIQRVVAILDRKKIGKSLIAFSHVLLHDHTAETLKTFETEVAKFPEVMECFQMTGNFDFILRIATSDMEAYHDFYRNKLARLPNITTVQSYFVLSETKSDTAYPI